MLAAIARIRLVKNGDEHRRNILQKIFRLRFVEESGVLFQLIRHLINNKTAAGIQRVVRFLEKASLLADLENAERNSGKNVIAMADASPRALVGQGGRIRMENMHARVVRKLPAEIARKSSIEFEEQEFRVRPQAARDFARMHTLARSVLGDDARTTKIYFVRHALDQRLGARDNGSDLKWALQKSFKEQN